MKNSQMLVVENLCKSFGALKATNNVNLELQKGELHALIGPNGAGKSTLISQLCGEQRPDSGHIYLEGKEVTNEPAHLRTRSGLSRSFQITELCLEYTVLENVMLSLMLESGHAFSWANPYKDKQLIEDSHHWLKKVNLDDCAEVMVAELAHGQKRQLELAVALARSPKVLLLDEPMAGMGGEETRRMTRFLQSIKGEYTILLVEHDMDAVFSLADRVTVLVYGQAIFTGTPDEVKSSKVVQDAYLGEG